MPVRVDVSNNNLNIDIIKKFNTIDNNIRKCNILYMIHDFVNDGEKLQ